MIRKNNLNNFNIPDYYLEKTLSTSSLDSISSDGGDDNIIEVIEKYKSRNRCESLYSILWCCSHK